MPHLIAWTSTVEKEDLINCAILNADSVYCWFLVPFRAQTRIAAKGTKRPNRWILKTYHNITKMLPPINELARGVAVLNLSFEIWIDHQFYPRSILSTNKIACCTKSRSLSLSSTTSIFLLWTVMDPNALLRSFQGAICQKIHLRTRTLTSDPNVTSVL